MARVGKLGIELVEVIEQLIAVGPTDSGDLEQNAERAFERFMQELDCEYCEKLNNKDLDLFDPL